MFLCRNGESVNMKVNRTSSILAILGAGLAGYFGVTLLQRRSQSRNPRAPALAGGDRHAAKDFSSTRSAGPEAMRDPPEQWTRADEASDESFPASDPPPVGSRVD